MTDFRIASYNVENLFARPRAFGPNESAEAKAGRGEGSSGIAFDQPVDVPS